jgi:NAD(P)-dependent dehydrogenase (short-subunit alcohol dehydrogenase family)
MSATSPFRRVAIVTGAAQGIGESIALRLADDGLDLGINDIHAKAAQLESVAEVLRSKGARVVAVPADVSDEEAVKNWAVWTW